MTCEPCICPLIASNSLTTDEVIERGCLFSGIEKKKLIGKSRKRELSELRQMMMSLSYHRSRKSQQYIGKMFGGRDHSTVVHALKTVKNLCHTNKDFKNNFMELEKFIFN